MKNFNRCEFRIRRKANATTVVVEKRSVGPYWKNAWEPMNIFHYRRNAIGIPRILSAQTIVDARLRAQMYISTMELVT